MIEEWKVIDEYSNYEVSNLGRVRSNASCHQLREPKILSPSRAGRGGYYTVILMKYKIRYAVRIHRLVLTTFIGPPTKEDNIGHHKDGDILNNSLDNLEWSNHSKNVLASSKRRGEYHSNLTEDDVQLIRKLANEGILHRKIAEMFKMTRSAISYIIRRQTWTHI